LHNLDVSALSILTALNCSSNNLVDLNLKYISPAILTVLDATDNPSLKCIAVDDVVEANAAAGWNIDATATYNPDCIANKTFVPDRNFEQALIDLGYDNGTPDNYVFTDSVNTIEILDISGRNILDLTGIEAFSALLSLNCS